MKGFGEKNYFFLKTTGEGGRKKVFRNSKANSLLIGEKKAGGRIGKGYFLTSMTGPYGNVS